MPKEKPFVRAFQEVNATVLDLVSAMSLLRALSVLPLQHVSERQLLAQALQVLVLNQDLERCSIYLLEGDVLVNAGGLDWADLVHAATAEPQAEPRRFRLGEGLVGLAAQSGELQNCRSTDDDPRFYRAGESTDEMAGSVIAVPIHAHGETIGVVNASHPHRGFFGEAHERTLQVFANFLGQMILSRRLLAQMDGLVQERTAQLEQALAEARALKRRYAELSVIDELTGLHNRRHFFPTARAAVERALRYGVPFSLLLMDVDHFKLINDTYGHAAGDEVLRLIAAKLRKESREADVLARFGGEEFILALPETDLEGARTLAERIRTGIRAQSGATGGAVTMSLGIAHLPAGQGVDENAQQTLERLIREADKALYYSKRHGRDQCWYFPDIADLAD
ncbi:MAG: sensor domain-containing diguanylate cyclase [Thiohalobacteraceae bacterium]|nr:sensor domain-containing diguanylate cyclase [Gammaproteobacteria bacterium]